MRVEEVGTSGQIGAVYRSQAPKMWRALLAYTGNREVAEDAVSEAFAQALRRGDAIRSPERWVWKTAYRIAAGDMQRRSRGRSLDEADVAVPTTEPAWELRTALLQLTPKQRGSLILHYYGGYRSREIAHIIGSTPAAVRVHLSQGRRRLRSLLEESQP